MWHIGLFYPSAWHSHKGVTFDYRWQTPGNTGQWGNCQYFPNSMPDKLDAVVVHESIDKRMSVDCPADSIFFVPGEEKSQKTYSPSYLAQFDAIITSRTDLEHPRILKTHYTSPWWIGKTYDDLSAQELPVKTKLLSAVVSHSVYSDGHAQRLVFMKEMESHFKEKLVWYSRENRYIPSKWDGIAPFKYSFALENSAHAGYFTEKLADCFLSRTLPLYWGCTDIQTYFPDFSYVPLERDNPTVSIQRIEKAWEEDWYTNHADKLMKARDLVLNKYQFMPALTAVVEPCLSHAGKKDRKKRTLYPEKDFLRPSLFTHLLKRLT